MLIKIKIKTKTKNTPTTNNHKTVNDSAAQSPLSHATNKSNSQRAVGATGDPASRPAGRL